MHARITKLYVYPERVDEMLESMDEVRAQIAQISGLQYWFATSDRESGEGFGVAVYDTRENADAAAETARTLLAGYGEFFLKPPEVYEQGVEAHIDNA